MNDYKAKVLKEFETDFEDDISKSIPLRLFLTRALDGQVEEIREKVEDIKTTLESFNGDGFVTKDMQKLALVAVNDILALLHNHSKV